VVGSCEYSHDLSGFIKCKEVLDCVTNYNIPMKDSIPSSYLVNFRLYSGK
jgi:hypothetical protein